ncbi:Crp/Fnr family transcriptional regulator [Aquimarina sp. I32.4]|uniref:Crp/Fnr family transcriptional regulator n=1 Tax=Aquimarina sp. I32.4 TaxID=2053903 RepID=UPI000CDF0662|nr:Crp/Fnr family transcriptional regulator [Aquimarina sp. I32.4]
MKSFLSKIHKIDDQMLDTYISYWTPYKVPKKTTLTSPGQTERYIYFVLEGIQKSYYLNESKEHITFFAYAPSFSGVLESFFTQTPSRYYLETITDSAFLRIPYEKHEQLMQDYREIETLFRKATEQFLAGVIQRHHELMAFDIETRFKTFAKRSPHLFNMISQNDLASYLRIDSTNFSKLINKVHI